MSNYEIKINAINIRDVQIALRDWCSALHVMPDLDPDEILETIDIDTIRSHLEKRFAAQGFTLDIKTLVDEIVEVKAPKRERKQRMTKDDAKAILAEESFETTESNDGEWP